MPPKFSACHLLPVLLPALMAFEPTLALGQSAEPGQVTPVPAALGKATLTYSLADQLPDIAERAVKSVVSITTSSKLSYAAFDEAGVPRKVERSMPLGAGSGVILTPGGRIVTNAHVVENADEVFVVLADGSEFPTTVLGVDRRTDLALLQIKGAAPKLLPLPIAKPDTARLGEVVLAIGNPFGVGQSVSMGIISAKNRELATDKVAIQDFLQTDAAINPGNSGGALVNLKGELIGINSMIASETNAGVGFAIPVSLMLPVVEALAKDGRVRRAYLGIAPVTLTPAIARANQFAVTAGVIIDWTEETGPAAKNGLKVGDVIVAIDGQRITTDSQLLRTIGSLKAGTKVTLQVVKGGKGDPQNLTVTLGEFAEPKPIKKLAPVIRIRP